MERGPLALFGAILAVGLGPALWLGAQFGRLDVAPPGPPVPVDRTHEATTQQLMGGAGGGENQTGEANTGSPVRVKPRHHVQPTRTSPSPVPSSSPTDIPSASPSSGSETSAPTGEPSASPSDSTGPSGDPSPSASASGDIQAGGDGPGN